MYSDAERAILERYVTDPNGDVYAIHSLPEEVIAVIFAYVSRSPHSFRDNLLDLIQARSLDMSQALAGAPSAGHSEARERARRFHEKWVVGYGHNSVAEHAVAHLGVERISRLASAELELANPYLSFTEYSQRYQRPLPGGFVIPTELNAPGLSELRAEFEAFCSFAFERYEELQVALLKHLLATESQREGETSESRRARLEKLSFEDARYALPLAVHSNLGLTGNGRALRDAIVRLLSSRLPEVRGLAESLGREVSHVLPALLRHADASPYWQEQQAVLPEDTARALTGARADATGHTTAGHAVGEARLLDYTGREAGPAAAAAAMGQVLLAWLVRRGEMSHLQARAYLSSLAGGAQAHLYAQATAAFGAHDLPAEEFRQVHYSVEFVISEANWHQLLRHSRKVSFYPALPGAAHGYTIPPRIQAAGLAPHLEEAVARSEALVRRLAEAAPQAAAYAVTNAHRRPVLAEFDLWEWVHLARLRCKPDAQWDIRETMWQLLDQIEAVHAPLLEPLALPRRATV